MYSKLIFLFVALFRNMYVYLSVWLNIMTWNGKRLFLILQFINRRPYNKLHVSYGLRVAYIESWCNRT